MAQQPKVARGVGGGYTATSNVDGMPFQQLYWDHQAALDLEFLAELDALGVRVPTVMTDALLAAFAATDDIDARRLFATRALGEIAQGIDTYAILAIAVRDRAQRGILETFVLHPMGAPRAAIDAIAALSTPDEVPAFLNIDPATLDDVQRGSIPALFIASHGLARVLTMGGGMVRTFYNKSKHGPVLVRSLREGRPAFGPTQEPTVFVISRNTAPDANDATFWNAIGVTVTDEFMQLMREGGQLVNIGLRHLVAWVRLGLEHQRL